MREYNAEDGLNVLTYLGILNLTEKEREVFREKWNEFYQAGSKDLVNAIWTLYSEALPFICGDGDRGSFTVHMLRDSDFGRRLEESGLDEKLKQGIPLEKIFEASPERFAKTN